MACMVDGNEKAVNIIAFNYLIMLKCCKLESRVFNICNGHFRLSGWEMVA